MSTRGSFDNTGAPYDVSKILNPDITFNREAYEAYSPLFLSTTFALNYGISFASITATLVHTFLYFRKQIWVQARRSLSEQPDIHARLMTKYPQVPEWWYMVIFCSFFFHYLLWQIISSVFISQWPCSFSALFPSKSGTRRCQCGHLSLPSSSRSHTRFQLA